jgi:hypothetical protein
MQPSDEPLHQYPDYGMAHSSGNWSAAGVPGRPAASSNGSGIDFHEAQQSNSTYYHRLNHHAISVVRASPPPVSAFGASLAPPTDSSSEDGVDDDEEEGLLPNTALVVAPDPYAIHIDADELKAKFQQKCPPAVAATATESDPLDLIPPHRRFAATDPLSVTKYLLDVTDGDVLPPLAAPDVGGEKKTTPPPRPHVPTPSIVPTLTGHRGSVDNYIDLMSSPMTLTNLLGQKHESAAATVVRKVPMTFKSMVRATSVMVRVAHAFELPHCESELIIQGDYYYVEVKLSRQAGTIVRA